MKMKTFILTLSAFAGSLAQPLMAEHSLDLRSGEVSLEFDRKKILKGIFGALSTLTKEFNDKETEEGLSDELIDSYIYFSRHVRDGEGNFHDIIEGLKNGKIFELFPINGWLQKKEAGSFRNLIGMLSLIYDPFVAGVDSQTIEHLLQLTQRSSGRMREIAFAAIATVHQRDKLANPLETLDLQGKSDYLSVQGVQVKKGTVGSFLKLAALYNDNPAQREFVLKEIESMVGHLNHLGFFDLFDEEEFNASLALQETYRIYKLQKEAGVIFPS